MQTTFVSRKSSLSRLSSTLFKAAGCAVLAGLFAVEARAATFGWSGAGTGPGTGSGSAWLTAGNWTNNALTPTSLDIAYFGAGGTTAGIGFNFNGPGAGTTNVGAIVLGAGSTIDRTIGNSSTTAGILTRLYHFGISGGLITNAVAGRQLTLAPFSGGSGNGMTNVLLSSGVIHADGHVNFASVVAEDTVPRVIVKTGTGFLTFGANNTFSGGMLISAGVVQLGSNSAAGTFGTGPITNNALINFNRSDAPTFANVISGSGAINTMGGGTIILSGNNSFSGAVNVSNGVLRVANANALGTTAGNTLIRGNTLGPRVELSASVTVAEPFTLEGRQAAAVNSPTILNQGGNNILTGTITLTTGGGRYNLQNDSGTLAINGNISPAGLTSTRELRFSGSQPITLNGQVLAGGTPLDFVIMKENPALVTITNWIVPATRLSVSSGTLLFTSTATISNCAGIALASNALLNVSAMTNLSLMITSTVSGSGTVTGSVSTANGTHFAPGGFFTAGTLSFSNHLTMSGTSNALNIDFDTGTTVNSGLNDLMVVHSNLNLSGTIYVTVNPLAGPPAPGAYTIIRYGTLSGGTAANFVPAAGNPYAVSFDGSVAGEIRMFVSGTAPVKTWVANATNSNWDVTTTTNWFTGSLLDTFRQGDHVIFTNNPANLTVTFSPNLAPSSTTVDSSNAYTFTGTGALSGGSLVKLGTNVLNLNTSNSYGGLTVVSNGILKLGNIAALGATNGGTVVANGATLDLNAIAPLIGSTSFESFIVSGAGVNNTGAVINSSGTGIVNSGLRANVTLAGDTTFGGNGRWDVFGGRLFGNGYKLTKNGPPEIALSNLGDTGLGDIDVVQGTFTLLGNTTAGDPTKRILVYSNSTLAYWATGPNVINKIIVLSNAFVINGSGTVTTNAGPFTLIGSNTFNNGSDIWNNAPVSGAGSLTKNAAGATWLAGTNTYTGNTIVLAGRLGISTNSSISNSPIIDVRGGSFDVSLVNGGWNLASGQTLIGGAAGSLVGPVTAAAGTVSPGASPGTLNFSSNLTFNGGTSLFELAPNSIEGAGINDLITARDLTFSGLSTLRVVPLGALTTGVGAYKLFRYTNALTGGAPNLNVVSDSRYTFAIDTSLANLVRLTVSGAAANLVWAGGTLGSESLWDLGTTANWNNGGPLDVFRAGDAVTFDDSSAYTNLTLLGTLPVGPLTMNGAQTYTLSGSSLLGVDQLTKNGAGRLVLANDSLQYAPTNVVINAGTLEIGAGGAGGTIAATSPITNNATLVFNRSDASTFPNLIRGPSGNLRKEGAGTTTLSAANEFRGNVVVNAGILRFGNTNALGSNSSVTINSGGQVDFAGFAPIGKIFTYTIAGNGPDGRGALYNSGAALNGNSSISNVVMTADASVGVDTGRYDLGTGNTTAGQYGSFNANNFTLTKVGPGIVTIRIPTTNFSLAVISNGTLKAENFDFVLATNVLVYSNGIVSAFTTTVRTNSSAITLFDGGSLMNDGSGGTTYWLGPLTNVASGRLNVTGVNGNGNIVLLSNLFGGGVMNAIGGNSRNVDLLLNNDATFSGAWSIAGSTFVRTLTNGTLGSGVVTNNGGVDWFNTNSATLNSIYANFGSGQLRHIVPAGPLAVSGSLVQNVVQLSAGTNAMTLASGANASIGNFSIGISNTLGVLNIQPGASLTAGSFFLGDQSGQTGVVAQAGGTVLVTNQFRLGHYPNNVSTYTLDNGSMTMTLDPALNPSGTAEQNGGFYLGIDGVGLFTQNGGTLTTPDLVLDNRTSSTLGVFTNTYTLNGGTLTLGRWGINSGSNGLSQTYQVNLGAGTLAASVNWTSVLRMTLTAVPGVIVNPGANTISLNGPLSGGGGLQKDGPGTLMLNGTNTFTSDLSVYNGTLGGNGSVASPYHLIDSAATLAPGAQPGAAGVFTVSNGTLAVVGTLLMEVSRSGGVITNDRVRVFGSDLATIGMLVVTNIGGPLLGGEVFDLMDWDTSQSGTFASITLPSLAPNLSWDTAQLYVDGTIRVIGTPTILLGPASVTAYVGDNVNFYSGAAGFSPFTNQWSKNGADLVGATATNLSLTNITLASAGTYTFCASNEFGGNCASATLTVLNVTNIADGLIAWWKLDEFNTGNNRTLDSTTNLQHLSGLGIQASNVIAGVRSNAMNFNGAASNFVARIHTGGEALPVYQYPAATVAMWVKGSHAVQADRRVFMESSTNNNNPLYGFGTHSTQGGGPQVDLFIRNTDGVAPVNHLRGRLTAFDGNWHHITFVDNNGNISLYVDGQWDTNIAYVRGSLALNAVSLAGLLRGTYSVGFVGSLDDTMVWRRALGSNEAAQVFTNALQGPPVITLQPVAQIAQCSANATFTVAGTSLDTIRYQWLFGGTPVANATNSSVVIVGSTATTGNYSVVLSNVAGSVTSSVAALTITNTPALISPAGPLAVGTENNGCGTMVLAGASAYRWELNNAIGGAGTGWDLLNVAGDINIEATSGNPFLVSLWSLNGATPGVAANWNNDTTNVFALASASGAINAFAANKFTLNNANFSNDLAGGVFSLAQPGSVQLVFTPNHAPVASSITNNRAPNLTWKIKIADLLAAATTDVDGDARALFSVGASTNGATVTTNATHILYSNPNNVEDEFTYTVRDVGPAYRSGDTVRTGTSTIRLTVSAPGGTNQNAVAISFTNGVVEMRFAGIPGYSYDVQRTTNLTPPVVWTTLWNTNCPSLGLFDYIDLTPPVGQAYYRTAQP